MQKPTLTLMSLIVAAEFSADVIAPFEMPQLQRPKFPDHKVVLSDFVAVERGTTKNTGMFAKAIEACARNGGGQVVVPKGKWIISRSSAVRFQALIRVGLE